MNRFQIKTTIRTLLLLVGGFALIAFLIALPGHSTSRRTAVRSSEADPWTPAQTASPAFLAAELKHEKDAAPLIIYVGVRTLYNGGHIPGAVFHGSSSTEAVLNDLKKFASTLPKNSNIVLYCGCCPLERCPNIRPAFNALDKMGFTRLRVLLLPTSFAADWAEKGYPVEKAAP
jgi:thiosulfate/3-mercaptopyruvate sulfurtransferase